MKPKIKYKAKKILFLGLLICCNIKFAGSEPSDAVGISLTDTKSLSNIMMEYEGEVIGDFSSGFEKISSVYSLMLDLIENKAKRDGEIILLSECEDEGEDGFSQTEIVTTVRYLCYEPASFSLKIVSERPKFGWHETEIDSKSELKRFFENMHDLLNIWKSEVQGYLTHIKGDYGYLSVVFDDLKNSKKSLEKIFSEEESTKGVKFKTLIDLYNLFYPDLCRIHMGMQKILNFKKDAFQRFNLAKFFDQTRKRSLSTEESWFPSFFAELENAYNEIAENCNLSSESLNEAIDMMDKLKARIYKKKNWPELELIYLSGKLMEVTEDDLAQLDSPNGSEK